MPSRLYTDFAHTGNNAASIAASSTSATSSVDMIGALTCTALIIVHAGDKTLDAKWQRDDNSGFTSATDCTAGISGAVALTQIASGTSTGIYCMRLRKPAERYVRILYTTGSGGATNRSVTTVFFLEDRYAPGSITVSSTLAQDIFGHEEA